MPSGFPPIAAPDARVLILGTMPSEASLQKQQYYGYGRNAFWPILYALWDEPFEEDYEKRCRFLTGRGIALWDVLAACDRPGSARRRYPESGAERYGCLCCRPSPD